MATKGKVLICVGPYTEKGYHLYHLCSVLQIGSKKNQWYLDNGCSKHMIEELTKFTRLAGNLHALVVVDDYSRFTWTLFLAHKNDAYIAFKKLAKVLQNENGCCIKSIRSDHGGEFQNARLERFCEKHGISHLFSP